MIHDDDDGRVRDHDRDRVHLHGRGHDRDARYRQLRWVRNPSIPLLISFAPVTVIPIRTFRISDQYVVRTFVARGDHHRPVLSNLSKPGRLDRERWHLDSRVYGG